jgi:hypothetical protein
MKLRNKFNKDYFLKKIIKKLTPLLFKETKSTFFSRIKTPMFSSDLCIVFDFSGHDIP